MVKLLAFTDSHGDLNAAESILSLARGEHPDVILCSGDFSYFGAEYEEFLRKLQELKKPIWFVPGNHETMEFSREIEIKYPFMKDVSYRTVELSGIRVSGVPGTNEFWPGQTEEDEAYDTATQLCNSLDPSNPLIFLTHFPPRGTTLDGRSHPAPDSGGSEVIRRIIEELRPSFVICGHYHQDFGKTTRMGRSMIINPGPNGAIMTV